MWIVDLFIDREQVPVVPETVSEKGYKETVQVSESTILVVSKAQSGKSHLQ